MVGAGRESLLLTREGRAQEGWQALMRAIGDVKDRRLDRPPKVVAEAGLTALVENTGIPFYTTPQGRGVVPDDHDHSYLSMRSAAFAEADFFLVVGTRLNYVMGHLEPPRFNADAKVARIEIDALQPPVVPYLRGMLAEEQAANSRYFYELASARFGFSWDKVAKVQAFHFKGGQGAKTGTGGHLPASKVSARIAEVRGLAVGQDAISPARFPDWTEPSQFRDFASEVRARTGGIPIGFKLSAQHVERDIDAALEVGVDYIIIDGRGGGTGAAPLLFRDNLQRRRSLIAV